MYISKYNAEQYYDPTAYAALTNIALEEYRTKKAEFGFRPLVFICSPFAGDVEKNIANAVRYSRFAVSKRVIPIAPHLLFPQFLDDSNPDEREIGLFMGLVLLLKCKEIWVFKMPPSKGMEKEIDLAKIRHMTIRYFDDSCREVTVR